MTINLGRIQIYTKFVKFKIRFIGIQLNMVTLGQFQYQRNVNVRFVEVPLLAVKAIKMNR